MASSPENNPLSLKDLAILMEAYKNNVELSTMLLEQQKSIQAQQVEIVDGLKDVFSNLGSYTDKTQNSLKEILTEMRDHDKRFVTACSESKLDSLEKYNNVKHMLWICYGCYGSVVLALVGLISQIIK